MDERGIQRARYPLKTFQIHVYKYKYDTSVNKDVA